MKSPKLYSRRIFSFRVAQKDDPPEVTAAIKCYHKRDRHKQAAVFFEEEEAEKGMTTIRGVKFLAKRFWIGHQVVFGLFSKEEAAKLWYEAEKLFSGIARMKDKWGGPLLALDLGVEVQQFDKQSKRRRLSQGSRRARGSGARPRPFRERIYYGDACYA